MSYVFPTHKGAVENDPPFGSWKMTAIMAVIAIGVSIGYFGSSKSHKVAEARTPAKIALTLLREMRGEGYIRYELSYGAGTISVHYKYGDSTFGIRNHQDLPADTTLRIDAGNTVAGLAVLGADEYRQEVGYRNGDGQQAVLVRMTKAREAVYCKFSTAESGALSTGMIVNCGPK